MLHVHARLSQYRSNAGWNFFAAEGMITIMSERLCGYAKIQHQIGEQNKVYKLPSGWLQCYAGVMKNACTPCHFIKFNSLPGICHTDTVMLFIISYLTIKIINQAHAL